MSTPGVFLHMASPGHIDLRSQDMGGRGIVLVHLIYDKYPGFNAQKGLTL